MQLTVQEAFALAARHEAAGREANARHIYEDILVALPGHPGALLKIAEQELKSGQSERARERLIEALGAARRQASGVLHISLVLGRAHLACGDRAAVSATVRDALLDAGGDSLALARLGALALDAGDFSLAERCFSDAGARAQGEPSAAVGLTLALAGQGRFHEAEVTARKALQDHAGDANLLYALGGTLKSAGASGEACVVLEECAARKPQDAAIRVTLGGAYLDAGLPSKARLHLERAVALGAPGGEVWDNLGLACRRLKDDARALDAFERALEVDPQLTPARANLVHTLHFLCEWDRLEEEERRLVATLDDPESDPRCSPFVALAMPLSAQQQLSVARRWSRAMLPAPAPRRPAPRRQQRLRVGYLSANFHEHPTGRLMVGLFEHHDRDRFEITGYSYGPDDGSQLRQRLRAAFDRWRDVRAASDTEIAEFIRRDGIDLLVDRAGHTEGGRLAILASRPAPAQVHYMSFPGTIGYDAVDAVIADDEVVPHGHEQWFHERVWRLPRCYYVNDCGRWVPPPTQRDAHHLPEEALVLACLNQSFKLRRPVFATWLAALRARPDAVLWLLAGHERMEVNLRVEAEGAGVAAERLVFAPRLPHGAHIARLGCADLALDTLPYGSHTTGTDALGMGVPMLTCRGATFAGRVGASLLKAAGLPELITNSVAEYGERLLELVQSPTQLVQYRDRLLSTREASPLFDIAGFTRDFESLLLDIYDYATGS
ncbi:MAG TPA: tetratricopeptide repeat protein [Casimicrobiaceae bacterium]|nr:tetratricopeptide repeat protein [Casimicrobiaceae bacterium]